MEHNSHCVSSSEEGRAVIPGVMGTQASFSVQWAGGMW